MGDLFGTGRSRRVGLDVRKSDLLGVSQHGHELQVVTDGMADGIALALLAQARRTSGEHSRTIGKAHSSNVSLRERLNLTGVENALHESFPGTTRGDVSTPSLA